MVYITTNSDNIVTGFKEASIDPIESKKLALKKMTSDIVLTNCISGIKSLERLVLLAKNETKIREKIKLEYMTFNSIMSRHIANNIVYTNPTSKNSDTIHKLDIDIITISNLFKELRANQVIIFENESFSYIDDFTRAEFWEKNNNKWLKHSIVNIGEKPSENWIEKKNLTVDQAIDIRVSNETDKDKTKRLKKEAFGKFLDRLFKESPEYLELVKQ